MKQVKILGTIFFVFFFVYFITRFIDNKQEAKPNTVEEIEFQREDLLGEWKQIGEGDVPFVKSFYLNNDSTAKVVLVDSLGERAVDGNWNTNEIKVSFISVKSDLYIKFPIDYNHHHLLMMGVKKKGNKLTLSTQKNVFEKELVN